MMMRGGIGVCVGVIVEVGVGVSVGVAVGVNVAVGVIVKIGVLDGIAAGGTVYVGKGVYVGQGVDGAGPRRSRTKGKNPGLLTSAILTTRVKPRLNETVKLRLSLVTISNRVILLLFFDKWLLPLC